MDCIQSFHIGELWGYKTLQWDNIRPDVNIIVGINGSGKTTLLNRMFTHFSKHALSVPNKDGVTSVPHYLDSSVDVVYLRSLDNVMLRDKRKSESQLLQELNSVVYQSKDGEPSFFGYRMRMLDYPEQTSHIQQRIAQCFSIINSLFADSGKQIEIQDGTLVFRQDGHIIKLSDLSSGEKQMLLILFKVFLTEEKPAVIFMDEPEISMHISWQNRLIDVLRELNPKAQLFLTTHSPSILSKGWGDKITYMEDIVKPM